MGGSDAEWVGHNDGWSQWSAGPHAGQPSQHIIIIINIIIIIVVINNNYNIL